jgi:hypothetical protein
VSRARDRDLTITTNGLANIVPDGVNNFDPWD